MNQLENKQLFDLIGYIFIQSVCKSLIGYFDECILMTKKINNFFFKTKKPTTTTTTNK